MRSTSDRRDARACARRRLTRRGLACVVAASLWTGAGCGEQPPALPGAIPFNFHVLADGLAYRSGQPTPEQLAYLFGRYDIRTVINLRGENPGDDWWEAERAACEAHGVALVNIRMSASHLPSREALLSLYDTFENAEYPILIHCQAGADRAGAASAIWRMVVQGASRDEAAAELSPQYWHFAAITPAMDVLVEVFEPDRDWIATVYDPANYDVPDSIFN